MRSEQLHALYSWQGRPGRLGKSDHELAIADFTKAIESTLIEHWQPYWWRAFSHNMKASFSTGDERITEKELALMDADKAIEINPMDAMLYRNRALMHASGQEALAATDRAMGECVQTINLAYELLPQKDGSRVTQSINCGAKRLSPVRMLWT